MQNNDVRRASLLTLRRGSMRRSSLRRTSLVPASTSLDLPWDLLDRLLIPILCCHAAAIILSGVLNLLRISDVSCFTLFAWFALSTGGAILFYHHLKVSRLQTQFCCVHNFLFCTLGIGFWHFFDYLVLFRFSTEQRLQ